MRVTLAGPADPRVLLHTSAAPPGDRGPAIQGLARGLADAGVEVSVVATCKTISQPWIGTAGNITVRVAPRRSSDRRMVLDMWKDERAELVRQFRESKPDVVHAHWTYEYALAAQDSGLTRLITIRDAPGTVFRYFRDRYRAALWATAILVARRGGPFAANSPHTAEAFRRQALLRGPIEILPNGLADPTLLEVEPKPIEGELKVLVVGNLDRLKNGYAALRAQTLLERSGVPAELVMVGDGLDDVFLGRLPAADRPNRVRMLARQPWTRVREELLNSHVLVHPSLEESFGNMLTEAMGAARPVVAGADSGAVPWVVGSGGILVNVRKPADIAAAVRSLWEDPVRAAGLGASGRRRVSEQFAPDILVDRHMRLYEGLIRGASAHVS